MKCDGCGKEFDNVLVVEGDEFDRGDGEPICPHCGYNNSPKVCLEKEVKE